MKFRVDLSVLILLLIIDSKCVKSIIEQEEELSKPFTTLLKQIKVSTWEKNEKVFS